MATPEHREAAVGAADAAAPQKQTRRRPSPTEHARRVAWGHKWGPLAAAAIKQGIERMEKR